MVVVIVEHAEGVPAVALVKAYCRAVAVGMQGAFVRALCLRPRFKRGEQLRPDAAVAPALCHDQFA